VSIQHPVLSFEVARSHREELIHRADNARLAGAVEAGGSNRFSRPKRRVGQALVRFGERLQATHRRANAGDLAAAAGALRLAR
jgi:hypothetical protein